MMRESENHMTAERVPRASYSQELRDKIDTMLNHQAEMRSLQNEMRASMAKFEANQSRLEANQTALTITIAELKASMMTRQEVASEIDKRVSNSSYLSDRQSFERRLDVLERAREDQPQHALSRRSAGWVIVGIVASNLIALAGLLVTVLR